MTDPPNLNVRPAKPGPARQAGRGARSPPPTGRAARECSPSARPNVGERNVDLRGPPKIGRHGAGFPDL